MLEALAAGDGPLSVAAVLALIRRPAMTAAVARANLIADAAPVVGGGARGTRHRPRHTPDVD